MSLRNIQPFPGNFARSAAAVQDNSIVVTDEAKLLGPMSAARAKMHSEDFNPLMERVMRAQQVADGRRFP